MSKRELGFIWFMLGMISTLALSVVLEYSAVSMEGTYFWHLDQTRIMIKQCEKSLPRDQNCILKAIPEEKK